jgi:ribose transport system ATP-binding protein
MRQACFEAIEISKSYGATRALNKVSIKLYPKEIVGVVGENGAGKSTLLHILSGIVTPDAGHLVLNGKEIKLFNYHDALACGISRVFQETALVPDIYVYENFFLSFEHLYSHFGILNKRRMVQHCDDALRELGVSIDVTQRTDHYDYATRQMIEITKAFGLLKLLGFINPIILLDEPTAALSESQVEVLFNKMNLFAETGTLLFVSHRLSEILRVSDRIYVFKDGNLISEENGQQVDEGRLHSLMVGRQKSARYYKEHEQNSQFGKSILEVRDLSKGRTFRNVNFALRRGEILGIGGVTGSGKEELGKVLAGWMRPDAGGVKVNESPVESYSVDYMTALGVGYIPKERKRDGVIGSLSVAWNISLPSIKDFLMFLKMLINRGKERELAKRFIRELDIKTPSPWSPCSVLSGGNQQKVSVSKWLARPLIILILDNPTMGIDVSILLISDDLLELIGLANRVLIMKDGNIIKEVDASPENKPSEREIVQHMV